MLSQEGKMTKRVLKIEITIWVGWRSLVDEVLNK